MSGPEVIGDLRLAVIYRYWLARCGKQTMPAPVAVALADLPETVQPNAMLLDVERTGGALRFRYRHVGAVFWWALGRDPVGTYIDDVLPKTVGYRDYVLGIYREMAERALPLYTENLFILRHGQADPMAAKRVSLPLSRDGVTVDMVLAAHVFDYGTMGESAFALVTGLREGVRQVLEA